MSPVALKVQIDRKLLENTIVLLDNYAKEHGGTHSARADELRAALSAPQHDLPSADDRKDAERLGMVIRAMTEDGVTLENGDDLLDLLLCAQGNKAKLLHIIDAAIAAQKGDSDV